MILMPNIRVAVCDDEEFYREELSKLIVIYGNETGHPLSPDICDSASALLDAVKSG